MTYFFSNDPYLKPFQDQIHQRHQAIEKTIKRLVAPNRSLLDFALGHCFFGLHKDDNTWVFREWAPYATALFLIGDFSKWHPQDQFALQKTREDGIWEIRLPLDIMKHQDLFRLLVRWPGGQGDRIPVYARRVHQDPETLIFNAQVWDPPRPYLWQHAPPPPPPFPLIYEAHVGMAQEKEGMGSYKEFTDNILPRIAENGYNTIQLMAIQHHPYYGSFGYHVSSFFAPSARFGSPEELKALIDTAHGLGIQVLMDLVHSHAVSNEVEGLSRFDGSGFQYFHEGPRGHHHAWDSRCFDYAKPQVLHFLLSNCRFWMDEFHVDGFRFDGVTSMLYIHHGLGKTFGSYEDYFNDTVDLDALVYLALANRVVHGVRKEAVTIAEDVSGMPGLAAPAEAGGIGFDYRFAMGIPDYWIQLSKDTRDLDWHMGNLWHELNNRRSEEKSISYAEAHDQALVGDQSLIYRLAGNAMYDHMRVEDTHIAIDRAISLHKIIRLITLATAGNGYLNFMGNEFGHPEWIDFPRVGNNWSFQYARRQWHLVDTPELKYRQLLLFDHAMIAMAARLRLLKNTTPTLHHEHNDDKVLAFERAGLVFAFNFHPNRSLPGYRIYVPPGHYRIILNSDDALFGGHDRIDASVTHHALSNGEKTKDASPLSLYLPTRTGIVLQKIKAEEG